MHVQCTKVLVGMICSFNTAHMDRDIMQIISRNSVRFLKKYNMLSSRALNHPVKECFPY